MYTECEDCGETVEAEITHNGVMQVGHYVHCGWGHQCAPEDLRDKAEPKCGAPLNADGVDRCERPIGHFGVCGLDPV